MENDQSKTDLGVGKPSEIEHLSNKVEQLEMKLAKAKQRETSLERELAEAKQKEASLADALEQIKMASSANNVQISDLARRNTAKDKELRSMTRQLQESKDQNKKLSEEMEIKKEESEGRKKLLASCFNQLEDLRCRVEEAERRIESNQREIKEKNAELQDKERKICLLQTSASSLTWDMAEKKTMLKREIFNTNEALKRRISSLEVQIEEERRAKQRHERLNRVLIEKLRIEKLEKEELERLADERRQDAEHAQAVIGVGRIMVQRAVENLELVDDTLHDVETRQKMKKLAGTEILTVMEVNNNP